MTTEMPAVPNSPLTITDQEFDTLITAYSVVLVDCWADWCEACHLLERTIASLAQEYAGRIVFARLNADENPHAAMKFGVMALPNILVFKNGQLVDRIIGAVPKARIKSIVSKYL